MQKVILFLIILLAPVVVHLKILPIPTEIPESIVWSIEYDIYTYWKAVTVIVLAAMLIPSLFYYSGPMSLALATGVYMLALLLSCLFSKYPYLALYGVPNYNEGVLSFVSYMIILLASTKARVKDVTLALVGTTCIVFVIGALQYKYGNVWMLPVLNTIMGGYTFWYIPNKFCSTLGNPNHLGLFAALLFPYFLGVSFKYKRVIPVVLMLLFLLLISQSRGAWLSVMITTCILVWKERFYGRTILLSMAVLFLCLFPVRKNVVERIRVSQNDTTIGGRRDIWRHLPQMLKGHVLIGSGPAAFIAEFPVQKPNEFTDRPHNIFAQVWHGSGLISLLALGCIIFTYFKAIIPRREPEARAMMCAVLGFLLAGMFTDSHVGVTPLFFAILGCSYSLALQEESICRTI